MIVFVTFAFTSTNMPSKFYVVWRGHRPGVYSSWDDCQKQIYGFAGAQYKSYKTLAEAKQAYENEAAERKAASGGPIAESISVDGACSSTNGMMEYRGVITGTKKEIFHQGPFHSGTNNIAEFLALVHALALCKQKNVKVPIYSDSVTAQAWLRKKKANTTCESSELNAEIFDMIARAEKWLAENTWENKVLKWETDRWGEIPADFGRK